MRNIKEEIIKAVCNYQGFEEIEEIEEVRECIELSDWDNLDFMLECNGVEIRVISDEIIESTWEDELENLLRECHEIPPYLENYIDYNAWVRDCKFDGMGHHFSSYDGSEYESENYYYFRVN